MKRIKNFNLSAALMVTSTSVLAHSGHEAIGDVLHLEYLFAVIVVAAALSVWKLVKRRH